ncbi:metallothiol transferase FosB [Bacillus shivajii]|uniref:metallothiol transferase FosB n=1 Tax=Bacillus shivajii TaxID=1983719 RepID=UPI001CFBC59E|nr:metallothiol transferase FosB [Bacillus shivajii]UCZ54242.1 metallothiol transferase FosB [Bacillus shivajii]
MELQGINHMTFSVSNLDRSIEFYENVLKAKKLMVGKRTAYFELCGQWIALNVQEEIRREEIHDSYTHIAFTVKQEEFQQWYDHLKEHDVQILEGRDRANEEGDSIYFQDPDGHKFEFHTGSLKERLNYYETNRTDFMFFDESLS